MKAAVAFAIRYPRSFKNKPELLRESLRGMSVSGMRPVGHEVLSVAGGYSGRHDRLKSHVFSLEASRCKSGVL